MRVQSKGSNQIHLSKIEIGEQKNQEKMQLTKAKVKPPKQGAPKTADKINEPKLVRLITL